MHKKLSEIATVSSGFTFRGSLDEYSGKGLYVVQAKNIQPDLPILDTTGLTEIIDEKIRNAYFLSQNDILVVSRGSGPGSFRASILGFKPDNLIASSSVLIIRVTDVTVLPKYIYAYLNSASGQKELYEQVTGGSYIQSLLVKNLSEIPILIPTMHKQKLLIATIENYQEQERLTEKKRKLQQTLITRLFNNID